MLNGDGFVFALVAVVLLPAALVSWALIAWRRRPLRSRVTRAVRFLVLAPLVVAGGVSLVVLWSQRHGWWFTVYYFVSAAVSGYVMGLPRQSDSAGSSPER